MALFPLSGVGQGEGKWYKRWNHVSKQRDASSLWSLQTFIGSETWWRQVGGPQGLDAFCTDLFQFLLESWKDSTHFKKVQSSQTSDLFISEIGGWRLCQGTGPFKVITHKWVTGLGTKPWTHCPCSRETYEPSLDQNSQSSSFQEYHRHCGHICILFFIFPKVIYVL